MIILNNGKHIGNYKKMPNRKKTLLTKEFCKDFKENIISLAIKNDSESGIVIDYSNESYLSFYSHIIGNKLFYDALEKTCIKHNVVNAIYKYSYNMIWCDADCFNNDLILLLVEYGLIPYSTSEDEEFDEYLDEDCIEYEIIHHYKDKGYSVSEFGYWDKDNKIGLEEIYEHKNNVEIIWKS